LSLFADAAGMSVKKFSEAMEAGEFVGSRFRQVFAKVSDELMNRFGTGAQSAAKSLQGLINVVGGDFQRTLESFAPLANAAAESILKPLGGAFRQLSVAAKLATGEKGRLGGQVTKQEELVKDLGAEASLGGPGAGKIKAQYEGAKLSLEALKIQLENFNELAKDPAVAEQAKNIKAFTDEIGKAASFVKDFALSIGGFFSPVLTFLGTNLTAVIGTVVSLTLVFQGARLGLLAFAGVMTVIKGVTVAIGFLALIRQVGSFSAALATSGTIGKTVAAIYTSLGISAKAGAKGIVLATGATLSFRAAIFGLLAATGIGVLIAIIGSVGAAFAAMGQDARQAAEDAKQAAKDMAEAARTGNVFQVEAGIREANAKAQLLEDTQGIVNKRSTPGKKSPAFSLNGILGDRLLLNEAPRLSASHLSDDEKKTLAYFGIVLPKAGALKSEVDKLLAVERAALKQGRKNAPAELALAKKQAALTGQAIPGLGLKGTELPEDSDTEKAAQRGATLLNAIEQREEAIADARKQREESIASIRKNAAEEFMRMEQALADRRIKIEREIIAVKQNSADTLEDIQRQTRIARGENVDIVGDEQKVADIRREERDTNLEITQRIADEEKEQARNIADFQKKVAKDIQGANEAHAKRIGEIQQGYARQVAKIIADGTGKAAKRLTTAAELAAVYIQRSYSFSPVTGSSFPMPVEARGTTPVYEEGTTVPRSIERLDQKRLDLEQKLIKQLTSSKSSGVGEQFTALLGAEGGYEDVAMTRGQAAIIIKKLEAAAVQRNITPDAFANALIQIGDFAKSPDESRRTIRNMMATPGAGMAVRSPRLLRHLATRELSQSQADIQSSGVNPASLKKQIEPMLAIINQLQKDNLLRKNVSQNETKEQIQKPLYGALMDWVKANLNNTQLQEILERSTFGEGSILYTGAKGLLPKAAGFNPESFGVEPTPLAQKEDREAAARIRYKATPEGKAEEARNREYARKMKEFYEKRMERREFYKKSETNTPGSFDVSKVATDFGTIAAASILRGVLDISGVPGVTGGTPIAQAYKVGEQVGYDQPQEPIRRLGSEVQAASRAKADARLGLVYDQIVEDSVKASGELTKQIDLIKKQAAAIRGGINSELADEFVQLDANYEQELARIEARKLSVIEGKKLVDQAKELRDKLKAQTKERLLQSKILEGTIAVDQIKKEIELLRILGDDERRLAELRKQYGAEKGQEMFDLQKIKEKIESTRALVSEVGSAIGDSFGNAFKGIITGSMTAQQALANFFQSVGDSFADMATRMIAEWIKVQAVKGITSILSMLNPGAALSAAAGSFSSGAAGFGGGFDSGIAALPGIPDFSGAFKTAANGAVWTGGFQAFADGGIVKGPTLGLVGEGRYNEAVVPLPDGKSIPVDLSGMGGGAGAISTNIVINVNNGQAQSNTSGGASDLGRKMEGAVKQVLANELRPGGLLSGGRR
jgi:hypothetical protein